MTMTTDIKILDLRFSWVFSFVLSPFDLRDLVNSFSKRGYATPLGELPPVPFRGRLGGAGVIARKNGFEIYADTDRQIISIKGVVGFNEFNPIIQELKTILKEDFDIDVSQNLRYCEVLATFRVRKESAIDKIRRISVKDVSELKELVGEYCLIGFRIGSKDTLPTQSNWFDIEVHPTWTNPNKFFDINVVYRNELEDNVIRVAKNLEKIALHVLKVIQ